MNQKMSSKHPKIAILGDLHIGVKNASKHHHVYMEEVLNDFFAYIEANKIKHVCQLGDIFDDRKFLHLWAWDFFDRVIQPNITRLGLTWYQIVGNHDSHYKESLEINTPRLRLSKSKNVIVVDAPMEVNFGEDKFLLVPWINKSNESEILNLLETTEAKYVCGHFEFNGFDLYRGQPAKSGIEHSNFGKFDRIYSGHYHTFSTKDNVVYAGTPYELTWQDCEDAKFFLVHQGNKYDKIPTKKTRYTKIKYDGSMEIDLQLYSIVNSFVRVIVNVRPDKLAFNKFIHDIEQLQPYELKIQETFVEELSEEASTVDIKDTRDVIIEYLNNSDVELDKEIILAIFDDLYNQAILDER